MLVLTSVTDEECQAFSGPRCLDCKCNDSPCSAFMLLSLHRVVEASMSADLVCDTNKVPSKSFSAHTLILGK